MSLDIDYISQLLFTALPQIKAVEIIHEPGKKAYIKIVLPIWSWCMFGLMHIWYRARAQEILEAAGIKAEILW